MGSSMRGGGPGVVSVDREGKCAGLGRLGGEIAAGDESTVSESVKGPPVLVSKSENTERADMTDESVGK